MRIFIALLLGTALLSNWLESSAAPQLPTLPQAFGDTTYSPPSGNTIVVNAGGNLQTAITSAIPGDTIVLQAGATFTGQFTLPNKVGSGWIYIQSSAYASLPPPGSRVSIADATNMPKIVGTTANAILTNPQAHNYRFVGIEIRPAAGQFLFNLVAIGSGETVLANLPHDITFDRCYIHGDPSAGGRRGIAMNGNAIAVIDSYVADFKEHGSDSQALASWNSGGPFKIVNNYLEAAGENVIFGGTDPTITNLLPSDITIQRNHFFKPLAWITENSPNLWDVKNLLEFKNAQRVLVEGNILENNWAAAQSGFAFLITPRNQQNTAPWSGTQDITFRLNKMLNVDQGINILGRDNEGGVSQIADRILIENNLIVLQAVAGGDHKIFQFINAAALSGAGPNNLTVRHNTGIIIPTGTNTATAASGMAGVKADQFDFRDNMLSNGLFGFTGTGTGSAIQTLATFFTNYTFIDNAIIGGTAGNYPSPNFFPSNNAAVGFVNSAGGDYTLASGSPFRNAASDGKDVGADIAAIAAATSGAASPKLPAPKNLRVQ